MIRKVGGGEAEESARFMTQRIARMRAKLRLAFLEVITFIQDSMTLQQIEGLLLAGQTEQAVALATQAFNAFAGDYINVMVISGQETAAFLQSQLNVIMTFDQSNLRAVAMMQENRLRLVREFTDAQRLATRSALTDGISRGLNPRQQAVAFRQSIGLTAHQQGSVNNFRRMLVEGDSELFSRKLRDRRFDATIRRSFAADEPLSRQKVETMVGRYRERFIKHRSEVIARTESLRSVHQGAELMYEQAAEEGTIEPDSLESTWNTAGDDRVRDFEGGGKTSHRTMNGQTRAQGIPFTSGAGNQLKHPGDPNAPAEDTVMCRCVVTRRVKAATASAAA